MGPVTKFLPCLVTLLGVVGVIGTPITSDGNADLLIEGGSEARPHEFPWVVSLSWEFGHFCLGTILSPTLVVTSASCASMLTAYYLEIYAGLHNLSSSASNSTLGVQKRKPSTILINPGYPAGPHGHGNDVALLKLSTLEPWVFDEYVGAIRLPPPRGQDRRQGQIATVAGWGSLVEEAITLQDNLRKAEVLLRPGCGDIYGEDFDADGMLCGVGSDGGDFCNGDVGGGLWAGEGSEAVLLGVASWGQGCGDQNYPGVYTDVAAYMEFIEANM